MADINIENFYRHSAKILSILYINFPSKSAVYVDEIAGIDVPDEYGLHSPSYTTGFFTLLWLAEEGYLRYSDEIRQDGIDQAALTLKAFLKLSAIVEPIYVETASELEESDAAAIQAIESSSASVQEDQKLVINQLRSALKSGSSIALNKVVSHILNA